MFAKISKTQKRKLLVSALVMSMLCSATALPSQAIESENMGGNPITINLSEMQPYWLDAQMMKLMITFREPQIYISALVSAKKGTTYKNGVVILEKISGSNCGVKGTWTGLSSNSSTFSFNDQSIPKEQGTYRLTLTITTVSQNGTERITGYQEETYNE